MAARRKLKPVDKPVFQGGFDPLRLMPSDAPVRYQNRWRKLAGQAHRSFKAAIELKCVECCAWERREARECQIKECPLWAINQKIFGGGNE